MNATTAPAPARASTPAPAAVGHKDALREKHAHAGVAMAAAAFAMAAASGLQALLYLSSFGVGQRTDGFFAAFALYSTFGIFSQSIRVTSAPLLVGDRPRMTPAQLAGALVIVAIPVAIATWPLASLSAKGLAPGLEPGAQAVTSHALFILGGAMILQLWAAGAATLLAVRNRFDRVAVAYISGALVGTVVYLAVSGTAGELSLGWSMLAMAAVTCTVMVSGVWSSGGLGGTARRIELRGLVRSVGLVLGSTLVYLAFNALFLVTVAFASRFDAGDATVVSYAYLFASYLVAGTGFALGLSRIADMRRGALADWREVIADTVPAGFRYSLLLCAPALAALVAAGAPLIGAIFPDSLDAAQVHQLRVFGALLGAWTVAALLVTLLLPAMFALGRAKLVNLLALPLVALHVAATAIGGALFGVDGVVCALCVAPSCFAAVLLVIGARGSAGALARELGRDGLRFCVLAAACFGAGAAVGSLASGVVGALIALAVGGVLYALVTSRLAARQVRLLVTAVRPSSA
jgi:peptidoglycan biosynthesis protein MviN/MurJ (putative lipid II flippase)